MQDKRINLENIRQAFGPLFGVERRETTARFLYAILISGLVLVLVMIGLRVLSGAILSTTALPLLICLFVMQCILLVMVRRGYVSQAAVALVILLWTAVTFQAWNADGIRDAVIYVYIITIFIAALFTNWQMSIAVSILSVGVIWFLALAEVTGLRARHLDSPLNIARDLTAIFILLLLLIYLVMHNLRSSWIAVREGEEKFRKIFHVSPVAIAITSLSDGRLLDANRAYWKLTGLDPALALGKTTMELGSWSGEAERQRFVDDLKEQKSLRNPAYELIDASGSSRTALVFYELIDLGGEPAILAMFYDVTEQKNSQRALKASEQKYRNFIEQSVEGIWLLGFDQPIPTHLPPEDQVQLIYRYGYVAESNNVLAQLYGYNSSAEIKGVRLLDLQPGGKLTEINYRATLKLVQEGYRSANRETTERSRDGKIVHFMNTAIGVIEDDCLIGLWGTQLDITALKTAEEALRHSEARTRALLDAIPDMIFEFNRDGTILQFISSAMNRPLLPPEQFLGKTIQDVLPASVADQTSFAIQRVLDSGHVHAFEYQLVQEGENKTFEARLTPLSTDTVLAIVRNVSLQNWITDEREKLITELEAKNAELERFTYTASHDLKSPLITIKGFLGFLREDARSGNLKRLDADIRRISDAADKMQNLLNDLLELSRVGRLVHTLEWVDLNGLISEVLELLHGRISGVAVPIRVHVAPNLPQVYADRPRVLEVWQNLIENAAKFMGDQLNPQIDIGLAEKAEDGSPVFFIRDNGIGIDPKFHERIFGLFDKLDSRTDGTGIGLALVKRIIEFHGGRIWLESAPGSGATFYFTLPVKETSI